MFKISVVLGEDRMELLIVDNSPAVHDRVQKALVHLDLDLHHAYDGTEGLALFKTLSPVVTIIGLEMSGMKATEFIKGVQPSDFSLQKIIVLIDESTEAEVRECYDLGIQNFVPRAFYLLSLRGLILSLTVQVEAHKELQKQRDINQRQKLSLAYQREIVDTVATFVHRLGNVLAPLQISSHLLSKNIPEIMNVVDHLKQVKDLNIANLDQHISQEVAEVLEEVHQEVKRYSVMMEEAVEGAADVVILQQKYWSFRSFNRSRVSIKKCLHLVLEIEEPLISRYDISVDIDLDPELKAIQTVRLYFIQMLHYLLEKVVKASSQAELTERSIRFLSRKLNKKRFQLQIIGAVDISLVEDFEEWAVSFTSLFVDYVGGTIDFSSKEGTQIVLELPIDFG